MPGIAIFSPIGNSKAQQEAAVPDAGVIDRASRGGCGSRIWLCKMGRNALQVQLLHIAPFRICSDCCTLHVRALSTTAISVKRPHCQHIISVTRLLFAPFSSIE